jgi:hypothetical protein
VGLPVIEMFFPECSFSFLSSAATSPVTSFEFRHSSDFKVLETTSFKVSLMKGANGSSSAVLSGQ